MFADTESSNGRFNIQTATAQASLVLDFLTAPVDSELVLRAASANGPVRVNLDPTYEGTFRLSTAMAAAKVSFDNTIDDPAGRGRNRALEYDSFSRWVIRGTTKWSDEGKFRGRVDLSTAMADAELNL